MEKMFKSSLKASLILLVLGLLLIFEAEATIKSISYIIGGILIAIGTLGIINFLRKNSSKVNGNLDIVYGTVCIILGIIIITNPEAIGSILPIVMGITIIINSAAKLQYAIDLKSNKNDAWKSTMIVSIISVIFGVVLLFNPFKGAVLITKIIGIIIFLYAILDIISTLCIKRNVSIIQKSIEENIVDAEIIEEKSEQKKKKKSRNKKEGKQ